MKKVTAFFLVLAILLGMAPAVYADADPELGFDLSSKAVYMVENDSGIVVYQKNADEKMYPAALTTLMTAILTIENCSDLENTKATAPTSVFDELWLLGAANVDFRAGEEIRIIDLLYAMILRSACEAAGILADYVGGGDTQKFVTMMNEKAQEIGAVNTHFVNPHGLFDEDQYTTARDMYLIFKYALDLDPIVKTILSTVSYELPATNKHAEPRTISHSNVMLSESKGGNQYYQYMAGGKTGALSESGRNFASLATKDAYTYTLITLGADMYYENGDMIGDNMAFVDAKLLYGWAFENWSVRSVVKTTTIIGEVAVELSSDKDVVSVFPDADIDYLMRKDIDMSALQKVIELPETVDAPVEEGQILGTMELKLADVTIGKVNLVAGESIAMSQWLSTLRSIKNFFSSVWFKLAIVILLLLIAAYIVYMILYNNRKRKRRRKRF